MAAPLAPESSCITDRSSVGEPARTSTATSHTAPRRHITSLASAWGGCWKCMPRMLPACAVTLWFAWRTGQRQPAPASSSSQKRRAKEPRASASGCRTTRRGPSGISSVTVKRLMTTLARASGRREQAEPGPQRPQAHELRAAPIVEAEAVIDQLAMQLLHPGRDAVLEMEIGKQRLEQIELDPIVARVGADLARIGDLGGGDQPLHLIADVAHLIVFSIGPDIDRLVVHPFARCGHEG